MRGANTISFILDDKVQSVDFSAQKIKPMTTVLNYLRSLSDHRGVKEGCAEGDCGACTVVLAEPDGNSGLSYKAVNSCLVFLPSIHGKQLITVENLALKSGFDVLLHPVQQALVDTNGVQCGYCTPGIVMSLFALFKSKQKPKQEEITESLAGNLCRCTGYQSIIQAAKKACQVAKKDHFSEKEKEISLMLKKIRSQYASVNIETGEHQYFLPATISEALLLREKYPDAILVNGATDIALRQTKKHQNLSKIIDLSSVEELKFIEETETEWVIGSGQKLEDLKDYFHERFSAFHSMLSVFGSRQIRNMATLGGNLGTASPVGDTLPLLTASNARINLISAGGIRELPMEKFISGYRETALQRNELIRGISIPKPLDRMIRFYKVSKRRDVDISTVSAAFSLMLNEGIVEDIVMVYGGMAETTKRAKNTEKYLIHQPWNEQTIQTAMEKLIHEFDPISDARSEAQFRKTAAGNLLMKFYLETIE